MALNWCYEYDAFIKKNYRRSDNIVRTTLEETPVYTPYFCSSLKETADVANDNWCHLFVAKTSSFSYILNEDQFEHLERTQAARESAQAIRSRIPFTFDLLIVDEAHYFRNRDGGSLRVNSAQGFFNGDGAGPLADRVLLMTATPNHSGVHDIKNIVSYFDGDLAEMRSDAILDAVGVRRFRRLAGKNKYQYRKEVSDVADFGGDLEAELFFALYQKRLATLYRGKGGCRFMYGYLEGFESMTPAVEILTEEAEASDHKRDPDSTDYHQSIDTDILKTLSAEFKHFSGKPPAHPKYNTFIGIVTRKIASSDVWSPATDISDLKHLVFTRRIPSVTEITGRINQVGEAAFLLSRYPFLSGTLDETQLVSFLKKKLEVEKITDRCGAVQAEKTIDIDCSFQDWQRLLRTPVEKSEEQDPYPALVDCPSTYEARQDPFPDFNPEALLMQIYQTMTEMRGCERAIADFTLYTPAPADSGDHIRSRRTIGMADVVLRNERHQPFYIELFFSSEFSGIVKGLVYCLRFVTPFDEGHNHKKLGRQLYERWVAPDFHTQYPLAKLAVKSTGDYRNCMIVDLPFFFEKEVVPHLDNSEIALGLEQVLLGADKLEEVAFEGKKDLRIQPHGFEEFGNGNCAAEKHSCDQKEKVWEVPSCWEQTERCLVSHFVVGNQGIKGYGKDLLACLTANYDMPALCFYQGSNGCCCRLPLPFVDLQPKELDLFEKWRDLNQRRFS